MVAWRHTRKRIRYSDADVDDPDGVELDIAATSIQLSSNEEITSSSKTSVSNDCFHVSHSYTEFDDSSSPLLLAAARDDDETDESVVLDTVSSHSGDVVNSESFSDEGSESDPATISDRAEEQGNGMIAFFREAVLRLVEIKGTVGFSIKTFEDKRWTKKYHDPNPKNKCFGAKVIITLNNGKKITQQLERADAHPYGARPFKRINYIKKFRTLTDNIISRKESERFLKEVQNLKKLKNGQLDKLNIEINNKKIKRDKRKSIF